MNCCVLPFPFFYTNCLNIYLQSNEHLELRKAELVVANITPARAPPPTPVPAPPQQIKKKVDAHGGTPEVLRVRVKAKAKVRVGVGVRIRAVPISQSRRRWHARGNSSNCAT